MATLQIKKDFQKVIKDYRTANNCGAYPKPMLTAVQQAKYEATVNLGGEWATVETTKSRADAVMAYDGFRAFLNKYSATATLELNNFGTYQIRIKYPQEATGLTRARYGTSMYGGYYAQSVDGKINLHSDKWFDLFEQAEANKLDMCERVDY